MQAADNLITDETGLDNILQISNLKAEIGTRIRGFSPITLNIYFI